MTAEKHPAWVPYIDTPEFAESSALYGALNAVIAGKDFSETYARLRSEALLANRLQYTVPKPPLHGPVMSAGMRHGQLVAQVEQVTDEWARETLLRLLDAHRPGDPCTRCQGTLAETDWCTCECRTCEQDEGYRDWRYCDALTAAWGVNDLMPSNE